MLQHNSKPQSPQVQQIISKYSHENYEPILNITQSDTDVLDYTFTSENRASVDQPLQFQNPIGLRFPPNGQDVRTLKIDNENNRVTFGIQNKEDLFFLQMNKIKERVLDLLNRSSLKIRQHNQKIIKDKLRQDSLVIKKDFDELMVKFRSENVHMRTKQKEYELQLMVNLIQEFIKKFGSESWKTSHKQKKSEMSLDPDETLKEELVEKKLESLREQLRSELRMVKHPHIVEEMVRALEQAMRADDGLRVRSLVVKLQEGIRRLEESKEDNGKVYALLREAVKQCQRKAIRAQGLNLSPIQPQKTSQSARNILIQENYAAKRNSEHCGSSFGEEKRVFFDKAFAKKNSLAADHPGKHKMVYELYDEFLRRGLGESAVDEFLEESFNRVTLNTLS